MRHHHQLRGMFHQRIVHLKSEDSHRYYTLYILSPLPFKLGVTIGKAPFGSLPKLFNFFFAHLK